MKTLPRLAIDWDVSLDALRKLLRANPELKKLGTTFGATRVFTPADAVKIRKAFDARHAAMK